MAPIRKHYSVGVKLRAIEYAEMFGNRATSRALGIDDSSIRHWRQQKEALQNVSPTKRTLRHGTAKNPQLEVKLKEWVLERRKNDQPVSLISVRQQASTLAEEMSIEFVAKPTWAYRFLKRNGLRLTKGGKGAKSTEIDLADDTEDNLPVVTQKKTKKLKSVAASTAEQTSADALDAFGVGGRASVVNGYDLHAIFRNLEQTVLGSVTVAPGRTVNCDLCDQPFQPHDESRPAAARPRSIRELICDDCLVAVRKVRDRESRLETLESLVATLKERTDEVDSSDSESETVSLQKQNASLKRRLLQYESRKRVTGVTKRKVNVKPKKVVKKKKQVTKRTTSLSGDQHKQLSCLICDSSFKTLSQIKTHMDMVHGSKNFECPVCPQRFTSLSTLQRHCKMHPGFSLDPVGEEQATHVEADCGSPTPMPETVFSDDETAGETSVNGESPLPMPVVVVSNEDTVGAAENRGNEESDDDTANRGSSSSSPGVADVLQCEFCSDTFVQQETLLTHQQNCHGHSSESS